MKWIKALILAVFVFGCASITPTPVLMVELVGENNKTVALYNECSYDGNFFPGAENCDLEALEQQVLETMDLAKEFISADIKQPQGYDIYLATAMIYFRIAERNGNDYSEAERIARQFFEVQKATSGQSINTARFYWTVMATGHASWQVFNDADALTSERRAELLLCMNEGYIALPHMEDIRKIRLEQYLSTLQVIVNLIE